MKTLSSFSFFKFLNQNHLNFAVAESCTGGSIAQSLTAIPGASKVFWGGVVSYSNDGKVKLLGVDSKLLEDYGAVSAEVALAMAEGLQRISDANLVLSVTGIAGPSGGSVDKPIGTVWFGLAGTWPARAVSVQFRGNRRKIQKSSSELGFFLALSWWLGKGDLDMGVILAHNPSKPFDLLSTLRPQQKKFD